VAQPNTRRLAVLLAINILLITLIVFQFAPLPQAQAQVQTNDYILIPGKLSTDKQIIWIIELKSHQLTSCLYNNAKRSIDFGPTIDLTEQFR
jgi:hypothetical protein